MSPEQFVPSHDPDMFEDVDSIEQPARPAPAPPRQERSGSPATTEPPAPSVAPAPRPAPSPAPAAEAGAPAPAVAAKEGRLYRSSGASGPLAAQALPALERPRHGGTPAPIVAAAAVHADVAEAPAPLEEPEAPAAPDALDSTSREESEPDWLDEEWPIRPARRVVAVSSAVDSAPEWLNPSPPPDPQPATHRPGKPSLLGRPTFSRGDTRRVGDGLLLARDGITVVGEWVLVGGAAVLGALIDVIFGGALGLWLPLLTFVAAIYGALRIRPSEWLMALVVPPIALIGAGLVIGQLALPAGRHLLTKEALLMANLLPSVFLWLIAMLVCCGAIAFLRSRTRRGPKVAA